MTPMILEYWDVKDGIAVKPHVFRALCAISDMARNITDNHLIDHTCSICVKDELSCLDKLSTLIENFSNERSILQ